MKRPYLTYAALALLAVSFGLAAPQPVRAQVGAARDSVRILDLPSLLAEAQTNNPSLRAMQTQARAMATRPRQVSALPDPTIMAGYRPLAIAGVDGSLPATVQAQQMIPYPGKLRLMGEVATFGAEVAERQTDVLALDLDYQIKEAYYELFRIQEQDRLIAAFQEQLEGFEEAAAAQYEVGQGLQQAILKAQLEKNALARKRLDFAAMRRLLVERLARLTNRPTLALDQELIVLVRPELGYSLTLTPEEALAQLPEAEALRAGMKQADTEVALAKKDYLPDFMIGAGLMDMMAMGTPVAPLGNLGSRLGIEFGVVIPLQRGRRDAALEEARLRRRELDEHFEALQIRVETEYNSLRTRLEEDHRALALYENTLVPQAEVTLSATLSAYTTGRTDFLDLLDAQRMLFDLQMDYEETYASYTKTRAALERTLGVTAPPPPAQAATR